MEMFDPKSMKERIGSMKKNDSLLVLQEVEEYFFKKLKRYDFVASYDVIANEIPYFKTLNYTEYAHCFMMHPLNQELRLKQMTDAYTDNVEVEYDYIEFFKDAILNKNPNKYLNMVNDKEYLKRSNLVVLVGSNKLKERICLNKLRYVSNKCGNDVWFKPHPITTHSVIGEIMDLFGEEKILPRGANLYSFLVDADVVYTSHMSESVLYSVCLDKQIEPIDVYNKAEQASYFHVNKFLFTEENPKEWVNRTFNSYKSGIVNPVLDKNWKLKVDAYLDYIDEKRESFKNKYIEIPKKPEDKK